MKKELYEAPEVQVINMEVQGIIAATGFDLPGIGGEDY